MTASRLANIAFPGSLLKGIRSLPKSARHTAQDKDGVHLKAIRQLPCVRCGLQPCNVAAHLRMPSASHGKPSAGKGVKPDDRWSTPLCQDRECHQDQHAQGEQGFWADLGINPFQLCVDLYAVSPDIVVMTSIVHGYIARRGK